MTIVVWRSRHRTPGSGTFEQRRGGADAARPVGRVGRAQLRLDGGAREPARVALHRDRVGRDRRPEQLQRPFLRLDGLRVGRDDVAERGRRGAAQPGQEDEGGGERRDPADDDRPAQRDHEPRVPPCETTTRRVGHALPLPGRALAYSRSWRSCARPATAARYAPAHAKARGRARERSAPRADVRTGPRGGRHPRDTRLQGRQDGGPRGAPARSARSSPISRRSSTRTAARAATGRCCSSCRGWTRPARAARSATSWGRSIPAACTSRPSSARRPRSSHTTSCGASAASSRSGHARRLRSLALRGRRDRPRPASSPTSGPGRGATARSSASRSRSCSTARRS